jgi:predicted amidophosphoribosyltransferase
VLPGLRAFGGVVRSHYESTGKLCQMCGERFPLPDEQYCSGCLIHADDEGDRACDACGSVLNWDGSCGCDLPPAGDIYWAKRR